MASPRTATRWLILQKARRHSHEGCSDCLWARGFRCCFTPLPGCFSPFPHGTGPLSVTGECLALEGGPPCFPPGFTCPAVLRQRPREGPGGGYGALALSRPPSHARSPRRALCDSRRPARGPDGRASTPAGQRPRARKRPPVWAGPLSLAATRGVSFDFLSSGYLDVSVPPVAAGSPPQPACAGWVPPFGHPRIRGRVRLPGDYRGLPRPSSASRAKASAVRPGRPSRAAPGRVRGPRQSSNRLVAMRLSRCPGRAPGAGMPRRRRAGGPGGAARGPPRRVASE